MLFHRQSNPNLVVTNMYSFFLDQDLNLLKKYLI